MLDIRDAAVTETAEAARTRQAKGRMARRVPDQERGSRMKGLKFEYVFSRQDMSPFDQIEWEKRTGKQCPPDCLYSDKRPWSVGDNIQRLYEVATSIAPDARAWVRNYLTTNHNTRF